MQKAEHKLKNLGVLHKYSIAIIKSFFIPWQLTSDFHSCLVCPNEVATCPIMHGIEVKTAGLQSDPKKSFQVKAF